MLRAAGRALLLGAALGLVAACAGGPSGHEETRFVGAVAGPTEAGRVEVVIEAGADELGEAYADGAGGPGEAIAMSGRLDFPGGRSIELSGAYDGAQLNYLHGPGYVIGVYVDRDIDPTGPVLEGYYAGPDGQGRIVVHSGDTESIQLLCGEFTGAETGRWAVVLGGSSSALAVPADRTERSYFLVGGLSGDTASYYEDDASYGAGVAANGTFSADHRAATGTWTEDGHGGDWSATASGCESPAG